MNRKHLLRACLVILCSFFIAFVYAGAADTAECSAASGRTITVNVRIEGSNKPVEGISVAIFRNPNHTEGIYKSEEYGDSQTTYDNTHYTDALGQIVISDLFPDSEYYFEVTRHPDWLYVPNGDDIVYRVEKSGSTLNIYLTRATVHIDAVLEWLISGGYYAAPAGAYQDVWGMLEYSTDGTNWKQYPGSSIVKSTRAASDSSFGSLNFINKEAGMGGNFPATDDNGKRLYYRVRQVDSAGNDYTRIGWNKIEESSAVIKSDSGYELEDSLRLLDIQITKNLTASVKWENVPEKETKPDIYVKLFIKPKNKDPEWDQWAWRYRNTPRADGTIIWPDYTEYDYNGNKYEYYVQAADAEGNEWSNDKYQVRADGMNITVTYIGRPELEADISTAVTKAKVGDVIPYTITVRNIGTGTAYDLKVRDLIGEGLEYVSDDSKGQLIDSSTLEWTLDVPEKSEKKIKVNLKVTKAVDQDLVNKAHIEATDENPAAEGMEEAEATVEPWPSVNITFMAGKGSGSDVTKTGYADDSYELPDCMFTPPEGMKFTGWTGPDGITIYRPGDRITLNKIFAFTAQYECIEHNWETSYEWADDNSSVTATRVCQVCGEKETEKVSVTSEVTTKPTCEAGGVRTWTSDEFENEAFEVQTKTDELPATGHAWGGWKVVKKATALTPGTRQRVCAHDSKHVQKQTIKASGVGGILMARMTASGSKKLNISWTKITGAEGYDIFFARCNTGGREISCKKVKTIKGNKTFKWSKAGLKKQTAYKVYVRAFATKNGKKTYIRTSPVMHAFTSGYDKRYTNAKAVTVNKKAVSLRPGKTFQIKGNVTKLKSNKKLMSKGHAAKLRYLSSNNKVAAVSAAGRITARAKGTCTIYVYSHNGMYKTIKVTVR